MEEEKQGITFSEIFKTIFSQKWLALALAVVITVAGALLINLVYNPGQKVYTSTFTVNLPVNEDGLLIYPDGTKRNYRDFVSKNNLDSIKQSQIDLNGVNLEQVFSGGAISISQNIKETANAGLKDITYTLKVKAKSFANSSVAVKFISQIAETPSREILKWVQGLSEETEISFKEKSGNENKLQFLSDKLNEIEKRFAALKNSGLSSTAVARVETLKDYAVSLLGELHQNWYEDDAAALQNYVYAIDGLNDELEIAQAALDNLLNLSGNSSGTIIVNGSEIAQYSEKVVKLNQQINAYKNYLGKYEAGSNTGNYEITPEAVAANNGAASKAFTEKLLNLLDEIKLLTDKYECDYYANTSLISYDGAQLYIGGGIGIIASVLLPLLAGVLVAAIVAYIVGRLKISKHNGSEATSEDEGKSDKQEKTNS